MKDMKPWKFSRSHQNTRKECPYLSYLSYYCDGTGYESSGVNVAQSSGTLAHKSVEGILSYMMQTDELPPEKVVDDSLVKAVEEYKAEVLERGFNIETQGDMQAELHRQSALVEGLIRAWVRIRLPEIHRGYKVIAVEDEWEISLKEGIVVMIRIDAILEDRESHELWPLEFKTTGYMDNAWLEKFRYDTQTLMHGWATEQHYPGKYCGGVKIEAFYKGYKNKDKVTNLPVYHSPLIRGYLKKGVPPEDEFSWDKSNARRKGWEAINVWEHTSMKDWVAFLPDDILEAQLFSVDVYRNETEVERWKAQTIIEQGKVRDVIDLLSTSKWEHEQVILEAFPANLDSGCFSNKYYKKCRFLPVCWEGIEPGESDSYRVRVPHHEGEFDD